jgi:hypothetical protein
MKFIHTAVAAVVLGATSIVAANAAPNQYLVGNAIPAASAERTIVIDSGTRTVSVTQGDKVKFVANGSEFAIDFDGQAENVDLRNLAPAGAIDHPVLVVVDVNPYTMGD